MEFPLTARYFATDIKSPDFVRLALAYGIRGVSDGIKKAVCMTAFFHSVRTLHMCDEIIEEAECGKNTPYTLKSAN